MNYELKAIIIIALGKFTQKFIKEVKLGFDLYDYLVGVLSEFSEVLTVALILVIFKLIFKKSLTQIIEENVKKVINFIKSKKK